MTDREHAPQPSDPARTGGDGARPRKTLALDVGGVHLKAVHSDSHPVSRRFDLCAQAVRLTDELRALSYAMPHFERLLVTMSGELCDCYASKKEGVEHIVGAAHQLAGERTLRVWSTRGRYVGERAALQEPLQCAAGNWHALATTVAGGCAGSGEEEGAGETVVLVDMGSTTTDVTCLKGGRVLAKGLTDTDRLSSGALVYLGCETTPVVYLGPSIAWQGRRIDVVAEPFATTSDVYLVTGRRPEAPSRTDTADGRPRTEEAAARRLARMVGGDLQTVGMQGVYELASTLAGVVVERVSDAIGRVVAGERVSHVIVAGSGEDIARDAAGAALPGVPVTLLSERIGRPASEAACAWALLEIDAAERVRVVGSLLDEGAAEPSARA